MIKYKRYERYKDSGVEWIGEIPEHWGIIKLKFLSTIFKGKNPQELTDEWREEFLPYLSMEYLRNSGDTLTLYAYPEKNLVTVNNSDILILWDGSNAGEIVEGKNGILSSTMAKIVPNNIVTRYLYWFLKGIEKFFKDNTVGMGIPHVNGETLKNHLVLLPNLQDQNSIANFLDQKTAEIDGLIADKEKLIELLQEKRQAIITEAVTKGLNPNVRMKDSGIEWIGEIPEHWEVKKIKYLTSYIGSGKTPKGGSEVYTQEGVIFIRSQNVYPQGLRLDDVVFISDEIDSEMKNTRVKGSDILLNITGASIGRASLVPNNIPRANVNQHVCIIRPVKSKVLPPLLHQIICSNFIQNQIQFYQNGTSREGLNFEQIANLVVVLSNNIDEQRMLVEYIEDKVTEIDNLIKHASYQIQKLKEYRKSLISEAVTGKIDVREFGSISEVI
jgi:type I restriction enzyme, S subunit